jgi:hypothetical protein
MELGSASDGETLSLYRAFSVVSIRGLDRRRARIRCDSPDIMSAETVFHPLLDASSKTRPLYLFQDRSTVSGK